MEDSEEGRMPKPRVLLCLTGSVAAVKAPQLAVMLADFAEVKRNQMILNLGDVSI